MQKARAHTDRRMLGFWVILCRIKTLDSRLSDDYTHLRGCGGESSSKQTPLTCHLQALPVIGEVSLCHLVVFARRASATSGEESLQPLLTDTVSSPCQAPEWSSRVGFPDGSQPVEKCQGSPGRHLCVFFFFFLIETGRKKICHFLVHYLGDFWRPLRATSFPSQHHSPIPGIRWQESGAPAFYMGSAIFLFRGQLLISRNDLQMLCRSICRHLHITAHVDACSARDCARDKINNVRGLLINELSAPRLFHLVCRDLCTKFVTTVWWGRREKCVFVCVCV